MDPEELERLRAMGFVPDEDGATASPPEGFIPDSAPVEPEPEPEVTEVRFLEPGEAEASQHGKHRPGASAQTRPGGERRSREFILPETQITGSAQGTAPASEDERYANQSDDLRLLADQDYQRERGIAQAGARHGTEAEGDSTTGLQESSLPWWFGAIRKPNGRRNSTGLAGGASQGVTFGFADELAGVVGALGESGGARFSDEDYERLRDRARANYARSEAADPEATTIGEVAGTLMVPMPRIVPRAGTRLGRVLGAVGEGSAIGGAQAAGRSERTGAGFAEDVAGGTLAGGSTGGLFQGGAEVVRAGSAALGRAAPALQRRADEARVLTASGATGGSIARPRILQEAETVRGGIPATARVMREHGMAPIAGTTEGLRETSGGLREQSRAMIGDVIEGVDDQGVRISMADFAERLERAADDLGRRPELDQVAEALRSRAASYRSRLGDVSMREAQQLVTDLGNRVNWVREATGQQIPNAQVAAATATRALRGLMDDAAGRAFGSAGLPASLQAGGRNPYRQILRGPSGGPGAQSAIEAYQRARQLNHVSRIVNEAAEESTQRASRNRAFGLMDGQAAQVGAQIAGAPGAIAAGGLRRVLAGRGAALRATGQETIAAIAQAARRNPGALARWPALLDAARRGSEAIAATHFVLMQQDPEYARQHGGDDSAADAAGGM